MNMLLLQGFEAFYTGNTMKYLRRFITALVLTVAFVLCSKFTSHATANILPLSTPAWFDAEYYAAAYPEVHALYGTGALDSGFDATMWFHYRNFGVYEGKLPAASPEWFDADFYARTYPDVAAAIGTNPAMLFDHYVKYGRSELRLPNASYIHTLDRNGNPTGATPSVPVQTAAPAVPAQAQVPAVQTPAATAQTVTAADAALPGIYVPTGIRANGSPYYIIVDRTFNVCNVLTVGSDGTYCQLVKSMLCSTGRAGHGTPSGTFSIYEHTAGGGWVYMADGTWAVWGMRFRTGGYMFHSVCFTHKGDLLPIPEEVAALGSKASLGCVRLSVEDAMWLYNLVPDGTLVTIA